MSGEGSNSACIDPGVDIKRRKLADASKLSTKDDEASSMQTSDLFYKPLCERADRLKTIHQLTYFPKTIRGELAKAVILHDYPLSIVDHMGFKGLFEGIYPSVSQTLLKSDIKKIYEFERDCSMVVFEEARNSRVAISTDKWISSDQTKRFLAITGHITDDEWKVQRRLMRFANVPSTWTDEMVANFTVECLFDWGVASRVSTIAIGNTSDDGLTDILVDKLSGSPLILEGKLLRMDCFARIMSLMVKDGFDVIRVVIEKLRDSILFWNATIQRESELKKAFRELGVSVHVKLVPDTVTKWNTTFQMLQTALSCKAVFSYLKEEEPRYLCMPSDEEWELAEEICQKLNYFYTKMNEVSKYHTVNLFFMDLCEIKASLAKWVQCTDVRVSEMASRMQKTFGKYWDTVRDTFAVATILDERFKLWGIELGLEAIYADEAQCESEVKRIRQLFCDLFQDYKSQQSSEKTCSDDDTKPSGPAEKDDNLEYEEWMKLCRKKRKRMMLKRPELETYLEQGVIPIHGNAEDVNILGWWRTPSYRPTLQKMAKDFLAIPIFSVAPEHMFDTGDKILSPHRSTLHPTMVETLMCAQSWLWTENKGCYSVTNSYSWGTSDDYAVVEQQASEG